MIADPNDIAVVVTGPDTRHVNDRAFELGEHECCVAQFKDHYVFSMPRNYGIPKELVDHPAMKFETNEMWGDGPLAILTSEEAAIICDLILNRWFVFVSTRATEGVVPKVGYWFDFDGWFDVQRYMKSVPPRELKDGEFFDSDLCRALKLTVNEKEPGFSICPVVVEKSCLAVHDHRMFLGGTWLRQIWDNSAGQINASELKANRFGKSPEELKRYPELNDKIGPVAVRRFLICHLFHHWEQTGVPWKTRSYDVSRISGQSAADKGNFRNEVVEACCVNPSPSIAKGIFCSLRSQARKCLSARRPDDMSKLATRGDLAALLTVLYPKEFGELIGAGQVQPDNLGCLSRR
jgi:hypothetical protein